LIKCLKHTFLGTANFECAKLFFQTLYVQSWVACSTIFIPHSLQPIHLLGTTVVIFVFETIRVVCCALRICAQHWSCVALSKLLSPSQDYYTLATKRLSTNLYICFTWCRTVVFVRFRKMRFTSDYYKNCL